MRAHYGYEDGTGQFYITVDTDACDGCEDCITACPVGVLEMVEEDPIAEELKAVVSEAHRTTLRDSCALCKREGFDPASLPCVAACAPVAISHSW